MTREELQSEILKRSGRLARWNRGMALRVIDLVIEKRLYSGDGGKAATVRRVREQYGTIPFWLIPILSLVIQAVVNALIDWWFEMPTLHGSILGKLSREMEDMRRKVGG